MTAIIHHETRHDHLALVLAVKKRLGATPARDERRNGQDAQRLGAKPASPVRQDAPTSYREPIA